MVNKQDKNVGNPGDTIKHGPIADLIETLHRVTTRLAYVDPFCYRLDAPLGTQVTYEMWREDIDRRRRSHSAYTRLFNTQDQRLAKGGDYRCGVGLALDAVGTDRLKWALLAEAHPATHKKLTAQLDAAQLTTKLVGGKVQTEAGELYQTITENGASVEAAEGMFALIDPFTVAKCPWETILMGLNAALKPGAHGIVIAFNFGEHVWPADLTPATTLRRSRTINEGPYNLAAYVTGEIAPEVGQLLDGFGWK